MLNESAKNSLIQGAKDLGVSLNEHQFNQLDAYLELLLKWNKVFNLTSIRDPEEGVKKHLLDCLGIMLSPRRRPTLLRQRLNSD